MTRAAGFQPRTTIFLGDHLRELRRRRPDNFSRALDTLAARYEAVVAELLPRLTTEEWRLLLPVIQSASFDQPGDAYLLPLRLKDHPIRYKLETMKLPELLAIIEAGQDYLAHGHTQDQLSDDLRPGRKK